MEEQGYIVGGRFDSSSMQVGDYTLTNKGSDGSWDSFLVKYDRNNEVEWASSFGGTYDEYLQSIAVTEDGGYIVGGHFYSTNMQVGDYTLTRNGSSYDAFLVKYDSNNEVEWASSFGGNDFEHLQSIAVTEEGDYIVGGYYNSSSMQIGYYTLTNKGSDDAFLVKLNAYMGANEQEEITFENQRKEYKITTDVKEIDGIKGGTISGEDKSSYEKVKYGDTSTKPIIMTPDANYEIIGITVNGKEYPYTSLPDDSFQMPQFENVTEDKHIVVTYALKDNKITINKIDSNNGESIPDVEFKLDQIDERTDPVNSDVLGNLTENGIIYYTPGNLTENGIIYYTPDTNTEVTATTLGQLTNNGTHYFVEKEGTLVPTNSKTYQTENSLGTTGVKNSVANSYMKIDLTGLQGNYIAVVNARVSSESSEDFKEIILR